MSVDSSKGALSSTNSLLSKWSVDVGSSKYGTALSGSMLSTSLLTLKSTTTKTTVSASTTVPDSPQRKRKTVTGGKAESIEKKKLKEVNGTQMSLTNPLLQSNLIGPSTEVKESKLSLLGKYSGGLLTTTVSGCGSLNKLSGSLGPSNQSSHQTSQSTNSYLRSGQSKITSFPSGMTLSHQSGVTSFGLTCGLKSTLSTNSSLGTTAESGRLKSSGLGTNGSSMLPGMIKSPTDMTPRFSIDNKQNLKRKLDESKSKAESKVDLQKHEVPQPQYDLRDQVPKDREIEISKFIPPEKDVSLLIGSVKLHDINGMKFALVNAVSGSLICQPNFQDQNDTTRVALSSMSENLVSYDPEFVLKVALYTRKSLNIRTTANFLLALAAKIHPCRPYLRKYFSAAIALPSDWIEVAEIYQTFGDKSLHLGSIPSALRRVMIAKFPDFDKYQLAKYNKESSKKKKKKKMKKSKSEEGGGEAGLGHSQHQLGTAARGRGYVSRGTGPSRGRGRVHRSFDTPNVKQLFDSDSSSDSDNEIDDMKLQELFTEVVKDDEETPEQLQKIGFTLKQLIRKLHIVEPVEHVMCLIGKKYPRTMEEFYKSRLPGMWEEERSGKRMKLPIPETWETQVSLKGNKASTWEELIDHKKLPFMAMLRNLRNLIKAGISEKHHNWVIKKLTEEGAVVNSKQFPFRFFSAYEVLNQLVKEYEESQKAIIEEAESKAFNDTASTVTRGRGRGRGRGHTGEKNWWIDRMKKRKEQKTKPKETPYDTRLINRYLKALDTAVKIATTYNVQPIRGKTIILCDVGTNMDIPCTAARGLGKPKTMREVGVLLGLMCKYSCEDCTFIIFDWKKKAYTEVKLEKGTILDNMAVVLNMDLTKSNYLYSESEFDKGLPIQFLMDRLRDRDQIDNLLLMTGGSDTEDQQQVMVSFLVRYREIVNPGLLYVNVSFAGKGCGFSTSIKPEHDNNIYISGFSDQILRFIAERGDSGQLTHVEKIDEAFDLKPLPPTVQERLLKPAPKVKPPTPLPIFINKPSWRSLRVFISSTFRDMHGERDLLTRFVFPELRALGKNHFINVYEVDLRWGVTEEETRSYRTLELCLTEVMKSQLFIGILGERCGWVPDEYIVPNTSEFDWVREYPKGASVTELEIYLGALSDLNEKKEKAFFYFRDSTFEREVPKEFLPDFCSENEHNKIKMVELKNNIRNSGMEIYESYPCSWGGVADGKPMVKGLEQFGSRVINNLWTAIQKIYPDEGAILDEAQHITQLHEAFVQSHRNAFVGRKTMIKNCIKLITDLRTGIIMLHGKPGTGKSALLASLVHEYVESESCESSATVITHVVGAAPGSTNILATLRRICYELNARFGLQTTVPEDFKNIVGKFVEILAESAKQCLSPLVLFMDGLDMMEEVHQPHNMEWLPTTIPWNVVLVFTSLEGGKIFKSLKRLKIEEMFVPALDMWDKAEMVRNSLAVHRKILDESPFNNQLKILLSKKEGNMPLFLKLACEELRVFGLYEKMNSKLKSLPQTVPVLLQEIISRLESDLGKDIVSTALSLLVCARDGLEVGELHDLLSLHSIMGSEKPKVMEIVNMQLTPENMLPYAVFSYLERALHTFLNPTDAWNSRLCLAHAEINNAVRHRYLKGAAAMEEELLLHRLLAGYFYQQADPHRNGSWNGKNLRALKELPYHLAQSGSFQVLETVVCSMRFVYAKCMMGMAPNLMEDYQPQDVGKSLEREQLKFIMKTRVEEYKSFVSRNFHILTSHPALTWQQASNEPASSAPALDMRTILGSPTLQPDQTCYMEWVSKPVQADPCFLTISNLHEPMTCVDIMPDNMYFACGGLDCMVYLYELNTGKEVRTFRGHADVISDICFAGTTRLCSTSLDTTVSIWDVHDGHRLHVLKGHQRRVNSCASDISGKLLVTGSWDCTAKVWSVDKGEQLCFFRVGSPVNCVSFHPEGHLIVTGSWDSSLRIWDVLNRTRTAVLRGHKSSVRDVAYSPSGRHLASAALDGDVKLWAAQTGAQVGNIHGHSLPINKIIFSPTGKELITVSDDHKIKVWSGHLGKQVPCIGDESFGPAMSVAIAPDGQSIAVGYHEGDVRIFDILTGMMEKKHTAHKASIRCIKYIGGGAAIITGSDDTNVRVFDCELKGKMYEMVNHSKPVLCIDATPKYIAIASEDFTCSIYDNPLQYPFSKKNAVNLLVTLKCHLGPVTSCTFNSDGTKLATASRDMSVKIWDLLKVCLDETSEPDLVLNDCHLDWISDCKWSNTGDFLITSSSDFNLKVWDIKSGKEKNKLVGHMSAINHISYSHGCVVSTCSDGSVKVWSHKGMEITTLYGHTQRVNGCDMFVSVSGTGKEEDTKEENADWASWAETAADLDPKMAKKDVKLEDVMVVTCGDDGTVRVWHPLQANELACLTGHCDKVTAIASDTTGHLCSASLDRSVKLWSPDLSHEHLLGSHDAPVTFVATALDGSDAGLITGSRDGVLKLWADVSDESLSKTDIRLTCVMSIKTHDKSVNCGCFIGTDGLQFVTGSDDGTMILWEVVKHTHATYSLKKKLKYLVGRPVSDVIWNHLRPANREVFFSCDWSGAVKAWNTQQNTSITDFNLPSANKQDRTWPLRLYIPEANRLTVAYMDEYVRMFDISRVYQGTGKSMQILKDWQVKSSDVDVGIPAHKKPPLWILDVTGSNTTFWAVDSLGQISCLQDLNQTAKRIHGKAVTNILEYKDLLFTASDDKTLKVWNKDLKQVGQFFCPSPVTCMILFAQPTCFSVPLVYGDQLGNVHFISWKTGIS
ncbi:hypothetical protein CHS0354_037788 [Potamilus streckersoni]|uniref:TROVE domain-containing protein n=1 Tax=Potamilus streckersoni TaxID=2493646 RepID=A0AAE0T4A8_9BIVA|nr:hypothetical protein CHS0354_037788 [Potamilus streckersoni]